MTPLGSVSQGLRFVLGHTSRRDKRLLLVAMVAQSATSVLDIIGVLLLATVGVVLLNALDPSASPTSIPLPWSKGDLSAEATIAIVAGCAVAALTLKSLLSWAVNRRTLRFMAGREVEYGDALYLRYMEAPFASTHSMTAQEAIAGIQVGSRSMAGLLTQCLVCVSELVLVVGLSLLLLVASPVLFVFSAIYFGLVTWLVTRFVGMRSMNANRRSVTATVSAAQSLAETLGLSRELRLYGLIERFGRIRAEHTSVSSRAAADLASWAQAPRYFLETALVLGMACAAVLVLATQGPDNAALGLGLFIVTASRLLPSIQRVNGAWSAAKAALGSMTILEPILSLPMADDTEGPRPTAPAGEGSAAAHLPGGSSLDFESVSYSYPGSADAALAEVTLRIPLPSRIAVVGPSGAGKTTLADLLLGLLTPTSGTVEVLGERPGSTDAGIAFVAQDVYLMPGSIRENVSLGEHTPDADDSRIWAALAKAQLEDFVASLPGGLDTRLGDRGVRMSGGQRQRVGLARALYREPRLLVLDEATSSLDADTEASITESLTALSDEIAVVTIAHRFSTIRHADWVVFLRAGRLVDIGSFPDLIARYPDLATTAHLQGL